MELWGNFAKVQLIQIPKKKNTRADELSWLDPSDPKITTGILVELLNQPSTTKELEVMTITAPNWRNAIIEYLKSLARDSDTQSIKLRIKTSNYTLIDGVLYKNLSPCHISNAWGQMKPIIVGLVDSDNRIKQEMQEMRNNQSDHYSAGLFISFLFPFVIYLNHCIY